MEPAGTTGARKARRARARVEPDLLPLRMAAAAGLTAGAKTKHLNAKVTPALFEAAARRAGSRSPVVVVEAALAALATQDDLGPWLAAQWGSLADIDPRLLDEIDL
jgi:hypothetical protein